ncbi:MAG: glycosyltransferase family 9 protein [Pirellulales bacterium]
MATLPIHGSRPRILIVRLTAIGDVIHGMPLLCALRNRFPHAHLAWVTEGRSGDLLDGHGALDALIRIERKWLKSPRQVVDLRRRLKRERFDVTIDIQGLTKSAVAARLTGAPHRVGFAGRDGRELSRYLNNCLVLPASTHVIDRGLELLQPLGIEHPRVDFQVPESATAARSVEQWLTASNCKKPFAVVIPGAGWPSKVWPAERFGQVAGHLRSTHGMPVVVVWAGQTELAMAHQVVTASGGTTLLAPHTTLPELAALLRRARLAVASDTGPLHLAVAVATASVGLFGPMPRERNGPYGSPHVALQRQSIDGTSRQRRGATDATMRAISVDDVCTACDRLLAGKAPRSGSRSVA